MASVVRIASLSIAVAIAIGWFLVGGRLLSLPLLLVLLALIALPSTRRRLELVAVVWVLKLGSTFLPFDVTPTAVRGGPKLLKCCPGAPYSLEFEATLQKQAEGTCKFCSDLVGPNEPTYYLVW
jgi:hypothetical protein